MKLTSQNLKNMTVATPGYDREKVQTGIVHLGIGAFHRAHQAVYIDDILKTDPRWGIVGASLRSRATADALNPQDGLYTVLTQNDDTINCRVIGAVQNVLIGPDDPDQLIAQMAAPDVRIVSLTVTEKGYCYDPERGGLDIGHADVMHDIAHPQLPSTAPGFLVAALARRRLAGLGPFTVLSCDNLPQNGQVARQVVLDLAAFLDAGLAEWITDKATFPATMVDRIAPATTPDDIVKVAGLTGVQDAWPVVTEPFGQWVIEDNFCAGRPDFQGVGVILTDDVHPFELLKLRLLNGAHSALAYRGLLAGQTTVAQAIADPDIKRHVERIMDGAVSASQNLPTNVDLNQYRADLIARFSNTALNHALIQIAADGSQKLPQRVLDPIRSLMSQNLPFKAHAAVIADWLTFIAAKDSNAAYRFELEDPLTTKLRPCEPSKWTESNLETILTSSRIFGADLVNSPRFQNIVRREF